MLSHKIFTFLVINVLKEQTYVLFSVPYFDEQVILLCMASKKKRTIAHRKNVSSFELILSGKVKQKFKTSVPLRAGATCPQCKKGRLDYNGLLALECPACGFVNGDGGGCT